MAIGKIVGGVGKVGVKLVNAAGGDKIPALQSTIGAIAKIDWSKLPKAMQMKMKDVQADLTKINDKIHAKEGQITDTKQEFTDAMIGLNVLYVSLRDPSMDVQFTTSPLYRLSKSVEDMFESNTLPVKQWNRIKKAPSKDVEQEYQKVINKVKKLESMLTKLNNEKINLEKQQATINKKISDSVK